MPALPSADLEHVLTHTRGLWEPVRGQNLFVTGGTGFFGRWLLESFSFINQRLDLGAHLTVLTRDPAAFSARAPGLAHDPAITLISGDVQRLSASRVREKLPAGHSGDFPFFIHAATESGSTLGRDNPLGMFDTIVKGTRAALDFAAASGTRRFLLTSSGAVYGHQPPELTHIPETYFGGPDCTQPASAYGEGKRAAELLCACYQGKGGLEPVIARCFAFVGPLLPLDAHFAIGNFIRDGLRGGPVRISGDGTPYRSYLYAADLAVWLWTLLFRGRAGGCYNVGCPRDLTILDLARAVAGCFSSPVAIEVSKTPAPGAIHSRYVPDVALAEAELGLTSRIPLAEGIARTAAWHRNLCFQPSS